MTTSGALYAGTALFNTVLSSVLVKLFVPIIYFYMVMSIAKNAIGNEMLGNITKFLKEGTGPSAGAFFYGRPRRSGQKSPAKPRSGKIPLPRA